MVRVNLNTIDKRTNNVKFGAGKALDVLYYTSKALKEDIRREMPRHVRALEWCNKFSGEMASIGINAFGTGVLSYLFIAHNPLSKQDEATKKYTALRQPISAVLAFFTSLWILAPLNHHLRKLSNEGLWVNDKYNMDVVNNQNYIMSLLKKAKPGLKGAKLAEEAEKVCLAQQEQAVSDLLNKGTFVRRNGKELGLDSMKQYLHATADDIKRKNLADLKRYVEEKPGLQIARNTYYRNNSGEAKAVLDDVVKAIETNKMNSTQAKKYIQQVLSFQKGMGANKELLGLLTDLSSDLPLNAVSQKINSVKEFKIPRSLSKASDAELANAIKSNIDGRVAKLKVENKAIDKVKGLISSMTNENKAQIIKQISKISSTFEDKYFIPDVLKKYINTASKNLDSMKRLTNLTATTAMTVVTCSVLNWIYPRFVDAFFPSLTRPTQGGGKKCE